MTVGMTVERIADMAVRMAICIAAGETVNKVLHIVVDMTVFVAADMTVGVSVDSVAHVTVSLPVETTVGSLADMTVGKPTGKTVHMTVDRCNCLHHPRLYVLLGLEHQGHVCRHFQGLPRHRRGGERGYAEGGAIFRWLQSHKGAGFRGDAWPFADLNGLQLAYSTTA